MTGTTIYTIGHSTRTFEEFVSLLEAHGVRKLVDVRTVPKSRRHPHFAGEALAAHLPAVGIGYDWMKVLGGLRRPRPDSPNGAWRNASFRGYADHMQSDEFKAAIDELIDRGRGDDLAIMCAEAVPWRCHRSLIGDVLVARGAKVEDISGPGHSKPHGITRFAKVQGGRVTYPKEEGQPSGGDDR